MCKYCVRVFKKKKGLIEHIKLVHQNAEDKVNQKEVVTDSSTPKEKKAPSISSGNSKQKIPTKNSSDLVLSNGNSNAKETVKPNEVRKECQILENNAIKENSINKRKESEVAAKMNFCPEDDEFEGPIFKN